MEKRLGKVNISAAGGTAGSGARTCKVTLPTSWLTELGIDEENRRLELSFDGEKITLAPFLSMSAFAEQKGAQGHELLSLRYYDKTKLCTLIYADFTDRTLRAENHTNALIKTAFGKKELPTWEDFNAFLEERCIPRGRAGLRDYLETLGLSEYDPLEIIQKTGGRMAEDEQWLEIEVLQ